MQDSTSPQNTTEMKDAQFAMRLSLLFGIAMLLGKATAYFTTHSAAVFSDAAESVIHVIAVGFASERQAGFPSLSLWLRANYLFFGGL